MPMNMQSANGGGDYKIALLSILIPFVELRRIQNVWAAVKSKSAAASVKRNVLYWMNLSKTIMTRATAPKGRKLVSQMETMMSV
jgi:hypothetical protein